MDTTNLRLLVHAGASSTRHDDDQRVMQAAVYMYRHLDVEPARAARIHKIWPPDRASSERVDYRNPPQTGTTEGPDSTTFIDDTQLAYTSLESQLIPSSARTIGLTPAKRQPCEQHIGPTASAHRKSARLPQSPTPRSRSFERELRIGSVHDLNSPFASAELAPIEGQVFRPELKETTQPTESTLVTNDTTSQLPTSYSLGDIGDELGNRPQLSERSLSDPGPSPVRQGGSHGRLSQVRTQQSVSREQEQPLETTTDPLSLHKSVAIDAGITTCRNQDVAALITPLRDGPSLQHLARLIQSAGPVTSVEPFTTHVTPTLNKLAQNPELTATYIPTATQRSLDVHERGHWEVHCSTWTRELQASFWNTLETVVGTGKAGWGVWCTRGTEAPLCSQSSTQHAESADQVTEDSLGPVRVYCWGEIVRHIYLLLFVASNSKVRKLGLRWIDAHGSVVIQMRAG